MFFLLPTGIQRPSILEKNKDAKYHTDFARYCLGQANNQLHSEWLLKIEKNKRFYKGRQWEIQEDIETFLKDDDGQERNRLAIAMNVIRPMVEQYRGNAIRMNINYNVKSVSPQCINRRESELEKMVHLSKIANDPENPFGPEIKKQFPVGDTEAETRAIFQNLWVDKYVKYMNYLAKYVSERNHFADQQMPVAFNLAFSGLGVVKDFVYAGHQQFQWMPSENYFWDRSAKKPDLTDAFFMGEIEEMFPTEIYEHYPDISDDDRKAVERYSQYYSGNTANFAPGNSNNTAKFGNGRVPVYKVYWMDGQEDQYGFVKDEYGYEYFTRINYIKEGEDKPKYTDRDVIKSESIRAKKLYKKWGGKITGMHYYDVLRMAIIIPKEIIGSCDPNNTDENKYSDIILDWGMSPYQETENLEYQTVKFPYKCSTWAYIDGEVLSPMDDAIDPQRFINRVFSMSENQLNNSRGSGTVIDEDLITGSSSRGEVERNMNQSKPIYIRSRGRGVQNAVGAYDGTRSTAAAEQMWNVIGLMKAQVKETTGVNDAIQGQNFGGDDQLVEIGRAHV